MLFAPVCSRRVSAVVSRVVIPKSQAFSRTSIKGARREKSAISSGCESRPANRSLGRKQAERYFEHLARENTPKSRAILVKADQIADSLRLDDELLDGLLVGLGLE
jgi:hypothetical protein